MAAIRVALLSALIVMAGCTAAAPGASTSPGAPTANASPDAPLATTTPAPASVQPTRTPAGTPTATPGATDLPAAILDPVLADIARQAGVPVGQVTIVSAELVTFPDGSLGCPVPDTVYIQVLVDGYKIVAAAGGKTYDYRGSSAGTFRKCKPAG